MERIGPFSPDGTSHNARAGGRIVGIERGQRCEMVLELVPVIGARPVEVMMANRTALLLPVPFFRGDALNILFRVATNVPPSHEAEAWLLVEYVQPAAA